MRPALDGALAAKLEFIQNGRETRRFHGLPMLDYQRIDAHQYGVAMLVSLLVGEAAPAARQLTLLHAALTHDLAEWVTGDMPAPTKRRLPDYVTSDPISINDSIGSYPGGKRESFREVYGRMEDEIMTEAGFPLVELDARDKRVLKLADAAEGCLHVIRERQMGNAHPRLIYCFHEFWKYCVEEQGLDSAVWRTDNEMPEEPGEAGLRLYIRSAWTKANGGEW